MLVGFLLTSCRSAHIALPVGPFRLLVAEVVDGISVHCQEVNNGHVKM